MKEINRLNREEIKSLLLFLAKINTLIAILFAISLFAYFMIGLSFNFSIIFLVFYFLIKLFSNHFEKKLYKINLEMINIIDKEFPESEISKKLFNNDSRD
tara:strand:+ start:235 stop:534 length:300 start_codon:yes stop_codon:yes gene_type:complete